MTVRLSASMFAIALCAGGAAATPIDITFHRITSNGPTNVASQFHCSIAPYSPHGENGASFTFTNAVGIASSISEIYFADGTILRPADSFIINHGTQFTQGANPGDLPGGASISPAFHSTVLFNSDAVGNPRRGVDGHDVNGAVMADSVTMNILLGDRTNVHHYVDFAEMLKALTEGRLRIGLHVRAIGNGGQSDSFVNNPYVPPPPPPPPPPPIPLPPAFAMAGAGLLGLGFLRFGSNRRRPQNS
jgi:hypothetical protein